MNNLYIVSTPIGNLKDITLRALEVLKSVNVVFAEDTRKTSKLFHHFEITTPLKSYHEHNVERAIPGVLKELESGDVALVSDSGTPLISDPGYKLVREVVGLGGNVIPVPGTSATLAALVASGLPTDKFCFRGFLPRKSGQIKREFEEVQDRNESIIYYESPHRIIKSLKILAEVVEDTRQIMVGRELTKVHEEVIHGTVNEVVGKLGNKAKIKGEIVLIIGKRGAQSLDL